MEQGSRALEKTSFNSHHQDQAWATASSPPDPHWLFRFLGGGDTWCLGPGRSSLQVHIPPFVEEGRNAPGVPPSIFMTMVHQDNMFQSPGLLSL
eukprot:1154708-Pelagomonas_calceolata.AAC.1